MHHACYALLFSSCCALTAQNPQQQVIPAAYAQADANSHQWIAGASQPRRQQTLIGASHLQAVRNHRITGFALRRTAANEIYSGGTTNLAVTFSTSPRAPLTCSNAFAANIGNDAQQVFQGSVSIPTSPADVGPNIAWSAANTVQVTFTQPFLYQGGTLCIDVLGTEVAGQTADWWMADAVFEDIQGTAAQIGTGCGAFGGVSGEWSFVAARTLLPGGYATFRAHGAPQSLGIAVFGAPAPVPMPMSALGVPATNCFCHLDPTTILGTLTQLFVPEPDPRLASMGGVAVVRLRLPNQAWILGVSLATQWLDLAQPATSNAFLWSVATSIPTLDMTLIEAHPLETTGEVSVHLAHVLRLHWQ